MPYGDFLKLDGVAGDREGCEIEVQSASWGASLPTAGIPPSGSGASRVRMHELTITKELDVAGPKLMQACVSGQRIPQVSLCINDRQQDFVHYKLTDVIISSVNVGGAQGAVDLPTESVSLNLSKFFFEDNKAGDT